MASSKDSELPTKPELPEGFLDGPAPDIKRHVIDFKKEGIPGFAGLWAVVLDGVLTEKECEMLVAAAEARTNGEWERAMINVGGGFQMLAEDARKCGRIIWDSRELAAKVWARVESSVPEIHTLKNWGQVTGIGPVKRNEVWKVTRLNERMRFLKYVGGEYFKGERIIAVSVSTCLMRTAHCDGCYETPEGFERSYFTLHLYLNDAADQLKGGATTFQLWDANQSVDVTPKSGRVLLFQQRNLMHSGEDVVEGVKYTMRTDIMYAKEELIV